MEYGEVAARMAYCMRFFEPKTKKFPPDILPYIRQFGDDCRRLKAYRDQEDKGRKAVYGKSAGEIFVELEDLILLTADWENRLRLVVCTIPFVADALQK